MSSSNARIETKEAKRLAEQTVTIIDRERKALDKRRADAAIANHNWWRKWFPWMEPMTDEQARMAVLRAGKTSVLLYWDANNAAKAILNLVKAAGSDPFINITAVDYERINSADSSRRPDE